MRRAVIAAAASLLVACSILTSFDGIEPHGPPPAALVDAAPDAIDAAEAGCPHVRWPDPPAGTDTGRDIGELVSAVTELRILDPLAEGKAPQGFDLDGLCTCPDRTACSGTKPNEPCDTPDSGIDNAGDTLFRLLAGRGLALDDTGLKMGIQMGQYGIVVRIDGYDGERDDPDVRVAVLNAVGVNGDGGVPREDGTDEWTIDTESLLDPLDPTHFPAYFSTTAYVTEGVLVAELPRLILRSRIPVAPGKWSLLELDLRSAHLVARLGARSAKGIALEDGRVAGRIPDVAMLAQGMRSGACRDSGLYEALKPVVCGARDLPLDPAKDGRDVPCEALSVGFGFASVSALVAPGSGTRNDQFPCAVVPDQCP